MFLEILVDFHPTVWVFTFQKIIVFSLFSKFWKMKIGLCKPHLCLCFSPTNFWIPERYFIKLDMYIMAPQSIKSECFIKSLTSVCVSVCAPLVDARQRLGENSPIVAWQRLSKKTLLR
jgi:hypothetical protein